MEKQKTRSEIEEKYKWDLANVYKDEKEWEEEYKQINLKKQELESYKGKILENSENLYSLLELYYDIDRVIAKLCYFARIKSDENVENQLYQKLQSKSLNLLSEIEKISSYILPEILKSDYSLIQKYCNNNKKLEKYKFFFEKLFRNKEHILSEKEEKILADFSNIVSNFSQGSNYLFYSEVNFKNIKDENRKKVKLTPSNLPKYIKSKNRNVRKQAYISSREGYKDIINTISSNFIGKIKYDELESKLRGFDNCLEQDLYNLNIDKSVVSNLIEVATTNIDKYQKYLRLQKKTLNVRKLEPWDLAMPLSAGSEKKYSYEEAQKIILDAFRIYGNEYIDVLKQAFDKRWIDVMPSEGKYTGWYSWAHHDCNPIVLANYDSKISDVSGLAHELGHLVHYYMNMKYNSYIYDDHSILEAEVASITNEIILSLILVEKSDNKNEKLELLGNIIEVIVSNFFGTIKGTEFLISVHDKANKNEPLTSEIIINEWKQIVDKYNGNLLKECYYINWARVPHYYREYYYYKYATGVSAAVYNAKQILNGDKSVVDNYIKYLKAGAKDYPKNNLKIAGIDIENKEVYEQTIEFFDELLDKFNEIYNS